MTSRITRQSVFDVWVANSKEARADAVITYVLRQIGGFSLPDDVDEAVKKTIRDICRKINARWLMSNRHKERFQKYYSTWLDAYIVFPDIVSQYFPSTSSERSQIKRGRPQKSFAMSSSRSKQRKVKNIIQSSTHEELSRAAVTSLRKTGRKDSAAIIQELSLASPRRGTVIKKVRKAAMNESQQLSADQGLALLIDANLSCNQYNTIRQQIKVINRKIYPPYYKIKAAKEQCYPSDMTITEVSAEIKVQSLINHTVQRLCDVQEEVFNILNLPNNTQVNIIIKWGCDGSEQKKYNQKFSEQHHSDESLFSISMVPIQLFSGDEDCKTIIWQNPAPSSTRYCRPIKFIFAKESAQLITSEVRNIEEQIKVLSPTKVVSNYKSILVKPILILCMIDGKVCNALSSCASSQTCYLCGAKPREMNDDINIISRKPVNKAYLSFGLSPLHSWIRCFECILHISYRLEIKSWQVRGEEKKQKVAARKKLIQEKFREEFGLLVDMPKQQTGNTNDGNTARKFFRNAEKSAEITGINVDLIKRFHIILEALNSGFKINLDKFDDFAKDTRQLYLNEYSWYSMPVSVHKILCHGRDIIESCILPIGQFSEEAQEARNKHNRQYRELFTRKTSRINTNTDLLHRLLITSDPFIASLRASPKTNSGQISSEVLDLLESPSQSLSSRSTSEDDEDSSDSVF